MKRTVSVWDWLRLSAMRGFSSGRWVLFTTGVPVMILAALVVPVAQGAALVRAQTEGAGVLTQIRVMAKEGSEQENLTSNELDAISAIPGVLSITPEDPATLYSCECGESHIWGATVLAVDPASLPPGISDEVARNLTGRQVIVPTSMDGEDLTKWVGRSMPATYTEMVDAHTGESRDIEVDVKASYPSTWTAPYPNTIFASQDFVIRLLAAQNMVSTDKFLSAIGFARVVVTVRSTETVDSVTAELRHQGLDAFPLRDRLGSLPETVEMIPALISLVGLGTFASATAFIVFAVRSALRRRQQEFGLLRLRGWPKSAVFWLVASDVTLGSVAGSTVGMVLGFGAGTVLADLLLADSGSLLGALSILGSIWAAVVALATLTALIATGIGLRRDPFIAIMTPA